MALGVGGGTHDGFPSVEYRHEEKQERLILIDIDGSNLRIARHLIRREKNSILRIERESTVLFSTVSLKGFTDCYQGRFSPRWSTLITLPFTFRQHACLSHDGRAHSLCDFLAWTEARRD